MRTKIKTLSAAAPRRMPGLIRYLLVLLPWIWICGIFAEWLTAIYGKILYAIPVLKITYSLVCHQLKERLITGSGFETMVCARCTGIYTGAALFSIIFLFFSPGPGIKTKHLLLSALPLCADVLCHSLNIYPYSKIISFSTGFLLGSAGFSYLYNSLNEIFSDSDNGVK
jgi:uncharacterized membrane protein